MNIPGDKEYFLDELVVRVQGQPHVNELFWQRLNKLRNVKLTELLFLHNNVSLSCLGRLTELTSIRSLIRHSSELVSRLHRSVSTS